MAWWVAALLVVGGIVAWRLSRPRSAPLAKPARAVQRQGTRGASGPQQPGGVARAVENAEAALLEGAGDLAPGPPSGLGATPRLRDSVRAAAGAMPDNEEAAAGREFARELARQDPEATARIIRGWLNEKS